MLKSLTLENIAIIDKASVDFESGMTVITGETGSGKSLLLDAISLAFGEKASPKDVIRQGQEKAQVELLLDVTKQLDTNEAFRNILEKSGIAEESELLVTREFTAKGSRSRLNGVPVSREVVEQLRQFLIDLHGQHELTNLFECDCQRDYLDGLGDKAFKALKIEVAQTYLRYQQVKAQIETILRNQQQSLQQRDFLQFQCQELADANLSDPQEDEQLQVRRQRLANGEQIKRNIEEAAFWFSSESPILDGFHKVQKLLGNVSEHDTKLQEFLESVDGLYEEARQLGSQMGRYGDGLEDDPALLNEIVARLDVLEKLKRKYGPTLGHVFSTYERLEQQLAALTTSEGDIETLQATLDHLEGQLTVLCKQMTDTRKQLAKKLEKQLLQQCKQLSLPAVGFEVLLEKTVFSLNGQDHATFLFSANPGEPLRPLAKVASGGELSRVLLALKVITAAQEGVSTLVFDEIDTGISGSTAKAVSEKLFQLSRQVQVIVITHQPVIAAVADHHWHVEKQLKPTSVTVRIKPLHEDTKRFKVLSQMIDGSDTAVDVAVQLRQQRKQWLKT